MADFISARYVSSDSPVRAYPTMAVAGDSCFSRCSSKRAGTSFRLLRSPEPPKMTIVAGSVGIALLILSPPRQLAAARAWRAAFSMAGPSRPMSAYSSFRSEDDDRRGIGGDRAAHLVPSASARRRQSLACGLLDGGSVEAHERVQLLPIGR